MSENAQGPRETDQQRARRLPNVLRAYARDFEKYGKPLDSGLPAVLEFAARWVEQGFSDGDVSEYAIQDRLSTPAPKP